MNGVEKNLSLPESESRFLVRPAYRIMVFQVICTFFFHREYRTKSGAFGSAG
jgi:hypothetical protein